MKSIYNKINKLFIDTAEKNTALNVADALYYGFTATYEVNDCGTTPERYNEIKKQVFSLMCGEG